MTHLFYAIFGIHLGSWMCVIYMAVKYAFVDLTLLMTPEKNKYMRQFIVTSLLVGVISGIVLLIFWSENF